MMSGKGVTLSLFALASLVFTGTSCIGRDGEASAVCWQEAAESLHALSADAPQISAISETTFPGETLVITGDGLGGADLLVRVDGQERRVTPISSNPNRMLAVLPPDLPLGSTLVWPVKDDRIGDPIRVNGPAIWWHLLQEEEGVLTLHLFGRNLKLKSADPVVVLKGVVEEQLLTLREMDPYHLAVQLPKTVGRGVYTVMVGDGTSAGWSAPESIVILAGDQFVRASAVVKAADFGAVADDDLDDASALNAAIASLEKTGGTLLLEKGRYLLSAPLVIASPDIAIRGAGCGAYNSETCSFSGIASYLKYIDVAKMPSALIEIRAPHCSVSDVAMENGNDGRQRSVVAVYAPYARLQNLLVVMQDKRNWGFVEPGPAFGTPMAEKTWKSAAGVDAPAVFVDTLGPAHFEFIDSQVHTAGPGIRVGTLQASELEKENEPASTKLLVRRVNFTGYYAGEPNENKKTGSSGRAVGVVLYNAQKMVVQDCVFQSADRANRKILCRSFLALNTSTKHLYLANNHSLNVGSHPSATGMDDNQGEQYLFHYRYPYGGLFDVVKASATSVVLDASKAERFKEGDRLNHSHYFVNDKGSRVPDEVGLNDRWIVFICSGKGVGQYREVCGKMKQGDQVELNVAEPWRVVPDQTSRFNLMPAYRQIILYGNEIDSGEMVLTHKTHGILFYFYAVENIVANNRIKNMTSGILFNTRYRAPNIWNLTRDNTVGNIAGNAGDTSRTAAGYVDHFRATLRWPVERDRVWYSVGNIARSNRFFNTETAAYLHTRFSGRVKQGLPPVSHKDGGMVMSVIENNQFADAGEGLVVESPANNCLIRNNRIALKEVSGEAPAIVVAPSVSDQVILSGNE